MNLNNIDQLATSKKSVFTLKTFYILFYIVFILLCVFTGILLFNYLFSLFINPLAAETINGELNLFEVLTKQPNYYHLLMWSLIIVAGAKALLFYKIIKTPYSLDASRPFTEELLKTSFSISYIALFIGVFLTIAQTINEFLMTKGIIIEKIDAYVGGSSEFLMTAGILYFVASLFKRGVEIQSESELTI